MSYNSNNCFKYLPINEHNLQWDLYLTGIGYCHIPPHSPYPPPGHPDIYAFQWEKGRILPEYQIICISQGAGQFESNETGKIDLRNGDIILLFPGVWHRYRPDTNTGWKEHWISINGAYLYHLAKRSVISPRNPILFTSVLQSLLDIHLKIWEHAQIHPAENLLTWAAWGLEILIMAMESSRPETAPLDALKHQNQLTIDDTVVAQALQIIWSHSYRNTQVQDIVNQLPVTRRTLERKFQKTIGRSIGHEITRCRLERAKHLLIHTALPVEHIALAVGYTGADRLGKIFQKWLKISPGQFRNKNR